MGKDKLTIADATRDEIIEFCFNPMEPRGVLMKQAFLEWLWKKRNDALFNSWETATEAAQKALHDWVEMNKRANDEPDIEKKIELFDKANRMYDRYIKLSEQADKVDKDFQRSMKKSYV